MWLKFPISFLYVALKSPMYPSLLQHEHDDDSLCDHLDHNKSHQVYLANIQEVRFLGACRTDCESSFIQGVLAHATQLQKAALNFDPRFRLYNMIDGSRFIPCGSGTWVCHDPSSSYEWNSHPIHK